MEVWEYAAVAKNARCFAYRVSEEGAKILRRYHRRRGVGVIPDDPLPGGKCFFHAQVPPSMEGIYSQFNHLERYILLSSVYMAPIVAECENLKDFSYHSIQEIRTKNYDLREFLRHLRIAEYSIVDFHISREDPKEYANRDLKRFWRIYQETGDLMGHYLLLPSTRFLTIALCLP